MAEGTITVHVVGLGLNTFLENGVDERALSTNLGVDTIINLIQSTHSKAGGIRSIQARNGAEDGGS